MISKEFKKQFKEAFLVERRRGYSIKEIKSKLLEQGYNENILNKLIVNYYAIKSLKIIAIIILIILLLMLLASFILPEKCETPACFIENANECEPSIYYKEEAGTLVKYQITRDCLLTKHVERVGEFELEKIKQTFSGKSMECVYPTGEFNPNFFELSWGIEYCEGPLKDAIYAIVAAVCPGPCEETGL